jgi:hypothetical protein
MPATATPADAAIPLPASWQAAPPQPIAPCCQGFFEDNATVSISAAHFTRKQDGSASHWNILSELGISGSSVVYGSPGRLANALASTSTQPWLDYEFTTISHGPATLSVYLLPTFPLDAAHRLRFAAALDGQSPTPLDAGATGEWHEDTAPVWAANVLRNAAVVTLPLGNLTPGRHTLRLLYVDPGVVFEHLVVTFPGAPPAYPVPPETGHPGTP